MDTLGIWVKDIFIIILSVTFTEILMPEGSMAKYVRFVFSLLVLAVVLSPLQIFLE